jgi:hypothetical protein
MKNLKEYVLENKDSWAKEVICPISFRQFKSLAKVDTDEETRNIIYYLVCLGVLNITPDLKINFAALESNPLKNF